MGGGIALLCAQGFAIWHPDLAERIEGIYTYGSPHLGDAAFCRQFMESLGLKALNFTHGVDIVPRLPPRLLQYTDACYQEWYITTLGHVHVDRSQVQSRSIARQLDSAEFMLGGVTPPPPPLHGFQWQLSTKACNVQLPRRKAASSSLQSTAILCCLQID